MKQVILGKITNTYYIKFIDWSINFSNKKKIYQFLNAKWKGNIKKLSHLLPTTMIETTFIVSIT